MAKSGRVAFGLVLTIAGSFHLVILPEKMPAMVSVSKVSSVTPSRLKMTAIGEM